MIHSRVKCNTFPESSCDLGFFACEIAWTCAPAAGAKSLQSCPTLCDPVDGSPPGPPIPGILEARTLEWVAISFSNGLVQELG